MNRASPAELREGLQVANLFARFGMRFVCMPVLDRADYEELQTTVRQRLEQIAQQEERGEAQP